MFFNVPEPWRVLSGLLCHAPDSHSSLRGRACKQTSLQSQKAGLLWPPITVCLRCFIHSKVQDMTHNFLMALISLVLQGYLYT